MDLQRGLKDKITNVEKSLSTIKAVLQDAEAKQHNSEAIKLWPKSVKYVMCDTDDLPDEISAVDLRRKVMIRDKICIDLNRYFFFLFLFFIAIFFYIKKKLILNRLLKKRNKVTFNPYIFMRFPF